MNVSGCCRWLPRVPSSSRKAKEEASAEVQVGKVMVAQEGMVGSGWVVETLRRLRCQNLLMCSVWGQR